MKPLLFALEEGLPLAAPLCAQLGTEPAQLARRRFPDGETYLRVDTPPKNRDCIILANLCDPDPGYLALVFLAATLRELGAATIGLVAPYLSYMRQDRRFREGEAITSRVFAREISARVDWLVTVDPHLHRYDHLDEIYSIPAFALSAVSTIGDWVQQQESSYLLVGPDSESRQWVSTLAGQTGLPFVVCEKTRTGDRAVSVEVPDVSGYRNRPALLVDDVISSGHTLMETAAALQHAGIDQIHCAAVHGIFAGDCEAQLQASGIHQLYTSNSIPGPHCTFDLAPVIAGPLHELLAGSHPATGRNRESNP
ncbi:ribose-phosphate diphosphokinase [Microbulbifer sp. JSM ZJ756]|uniref:ribose-phosphate diphosphokinase n=1 Tax=Microbulbifer sp. JSM ZJ756 TaxID=3376191 RepID=UPI0037A753E5